MSSYLYRCPPCEASSPPGTRTEAEAYRGYHRAVVHGGLVPAGEVIESVEGRAARDPDARYVSTRGAVALLAILAAASVVARVLGH